VGDSRHVDASAPPVAYAFDTPGTSDEHDDGWTLFFAEEDETLKTISRRFGSDAATLLDFNIATIAGLTPSKAARGIGGADPLPG
jgi:hypothetical protein